MTAPLKTRHMLAVLLLTLPLTFPAAARADQAEDRDIANDLAALLRAGRTVISNNQPRINDPNLGDKGLNGEAVLAQALTIYRQNTGTDPRDLDKTTRKGRLMQDEMDAIVEVMDAEAPAINAKGVDFKGFIPAVFGRLVSESFTRRAAGAAEMKVTAPPDLVRNRRARPDAWESGVIATKFRAGDWKKGEPFSAMVDRDGKDAYRIAVPEYYAQSCLGCHGGPKGATDVTGYPMEGASLGDLGGVISITLAH